ncbi:MAG: hypothetical protein CSA95_01105 [Bacteroidetes bacterium]|nr:MAG: hypothetical protein CSA95_01105 [Bacteroidota bacterium]
MRRGCIESSNSRLAKAEIGEFTRVNDHLEEKRNEEVGLYRQTLFIMIYDFGTIIEREECTVEGWKVLSLERRWGWDDLPCVETC